MRTKVRRRGLLIMIVLTVAAAVPIGVAQASPSRPHAGSGLLKLSGPKTNKMNASFTYTISGTAKGAANYLVAWERQDGAMVDVRGARISTAGILLDSFVVQPAADSYATPPCAGFDGTYYGVVWVDSSWGSAWGICGARIRPSGEVIDVTPLASPIAWQSYYPMVSMTLGAGSQALCAYPCWTDEYEGRTYNTTRIWGRLGALAGIQEKVGTLLSGSNGGTIVRGVLFLPASTSPKLQTASLLDISGRKVMNLRSGANDVRALSPGVYFVRGPKTEDGRPGPAVRKVVLTE